MAQVATTTRNCCRSSGVAGTTKVPVCRPCPIKPASAPGAPAALPAPEPGDDNPYDIATMEMRLIRQALAATGENRTEAAALLGISRRTLQRKLKGDGAD